MIREFVEFMGVEIDEIRSMGGGAKSPIWCTIKSNLLKKRIVTLKQNETACLGSAIFAGVGIGAFSSPVSATQKIVGKNLIYQSQDSNYDAIYADYKAKEKKLMEIF
jgi:xylulokinase